MAAATDGETDERVPLSRDRVLAAAVARADRGGIDSLTMRGLAADLGFEVMSLYNHVANKDDLLDGMTELVTAEVDHPPDGPDWRAAIRLTVVSAHEMFGRHRWAARCWIGRRTGPARLDHMEAVLRCLRTAGFSETEACQAFHALMLHMVGTTLLAEAFPLESDELEQAASEYLDALAVERYPYVAEHIRQHVDPPEGDDFRFALDLLLDGLERSRST